MKQYIYTVVKTKRARRSYSKFKVKYHPYSIRIVKSSTSRGKNNVSKIESDREAVKTERDCRSKMKFKI